jgi:hypothetical protein
VKDAQSQLLFLNAPARLLQAPQHIPRYLLNRILTVVIMF